MHNVYLGVHSDRANQIIAGLFNYYRDTYDKVTAKQRRNMTVGKIIVEPDGEVCLQINNNHHSYYGTIYYTYSGKDDILRGWVANSLKDYVRQKLRTVDSNGNKIDSWNRRNNTVVTGLVDTNNAQPTVTEIYALYELLKRRKNAENRYDKTLIETLKGVKRDPFMTELEIARREEIKRIEKEFETKKSEVEKQYHDECNDAYNRYVQNIKKLEEEFANKKSSINESMSAMTVAA